MATRTGAQGVGQALLQCPGPSPTVMTVPEPPRGLGLHLEPPGWVPVISPGPAGPGGAAAGQASQWGPLGFVGHLCRRQRRGLPGGHPSSPHSSSAVGLGLGGTWALCPSRSSHCGQWQPLLSPGHHFCPSSAPTLAPTSSLGASQSGPSALWVLTAAPMCSPALTPVRPPHSSWLGSGMPPAQAWPVTEVALVCLSGLGQ